MQVLAFNPQDADHFCSALWMLKLRDMPVELMNDLPRLGYIVLQDSDPVGMGFIRQVEGGFGQFDSVITNPEMPPKVRDEALNLIVSKLIELSKTIKLKRIVSYTLDESTILRSKRFGFTQLPHTVIELNLEVS